MKGVSVGVYLDSQSAAKAARICGILGLSRSGLINQLISLARVEHLGTMTLRLKDDQREDTDQDGRDRDGLQR